LCRLSVSTAFPNCGRLTSKVITRGPSNPVGAMERAACLRARCCTITVFSAKRCQQAVKWQLLARNPADAVEPPRPRRKEMLARNETQIAMLLEAARPNRLLHVSVLLAVTTGMRRGEILALRWRDIDFEPAVLSVRQSLEKRRRVSRSKNQRARRPDALSRSRSWRSRACGGARPTRRGSSS
jgi:integrase